MVGLKVSIMHESAACRSPGSPLQMPVAFPRLRRSTISFFTTNLMTVPALHGRHAAYLCAGRQVAGGLRVCYSNMFAGSC